MKSLTAIQGRVLDYIESYTKQHGKSPSQTECARHFNIAQSSMNAHWHACEKKGALRWNHETRVLQVLR